MSLPIVFRRPAKIEMDEAINWCERQREGLGLEFAVEVDTLLVRIAEAPEQFPKVREEISRAVRRFPYTVHFLNEPNRIVVLAVFHVKRNPRILEGR